MRSSDRSALNVDGLVFRHYAQTGGWRFVVLFHRGRKWLKVLETARFDVHTLEADDAYKLRPYADVSPKQLAKRIRSRRARFKRLEMNFPKSAVAKAIAALETS